jgi:hypothetical protein
MLVGAVAVVPAPIAAIPPGAAEPDADAGIDLEIVGEHQRAGAVHDIGERDHVLEHTLRARRAAGAVGVHHGLTDRDCAPRSCRNWLMNECSADAPFQRRTSSGSAWCASLPFLASMAATYRETPKLIPATSLASS